VCPDRADERPIQSHLALRGKAGSVLAHCPKGARAGPAAFAESGAERFAGGKAGTLRDFGYGEPGSGKEFAGALTADPHDFLVWGVPKLAAELALKSGAGHGHLLEDFLDADAMAGVLAHEPDGLGEAPIGCGVGVPSETSGRD
jgi:hypothetical protein